MSCSSGRLIAASSSATCSNVASVLCPRFSGVPFLPSGVGCDGPGKVRRYSLPGQLVHPFTPPVHNFDDSSVPTTNNLTEQGIGRYKIRVKTMRGVKSALGRETIFHLTHARLLA